MANWISNFYKNPTCEYELDFIFIGYMYCSSYYKYYQYSFKNCRVKENKIMGLSCKATGKFQSIMKKMENQLEAERKAAKEKKEAKRNKTSK